jgi:hypothetical protein
MKISADDMIVEGGSEFYFIFFFFFSLKYNISLNKQQQP